MPVIPVDQVQVAAHQWGQIGLADAGERAGRVPCSYEMRNEDGHELEQVGQIVGHLPTKFAAGQVNEWGDRCSWPAVWEHSKGAFLKETRLALLAQKGLAPCIYQKRGWMRVLR